MARARNTRDCIEQLDLEHLACISSLDARHGSQIVDEIQEGFQYEKIHQS